MKTSVRVLVLLSLFALTSSADGLLTEPLSTKSSSLEGCTVQFCKTCLWIDQTCCSEEVGLCECCPH